MSVRRLSLVLVLPAALCLWSSSSRAEEVTEPSSGRRFQTTLTYEGKTYRLLGVGLRKKFVIKVYAMGLYVEEGGARQAFPSLVSKAGGPERDKLLEGDRAQTFVSWGRFSKLGVLQFLRDVDKDKIQGAYRESLEAALSDKAPPELRRDAEAFVALFDRDVREGQQMRIHTDEEGKITVEVAGQKKEGPKNPQLCRAIWDIWLGPKPISKEMRRSLVDRIDQFARQ
ncbi:MAG: chalcone isomerase family protein [Myxococcales bacterium]|nr:chalcone isomerase family protein [Myxococcota bacterium]MDW8283775.1 chalcone isomerase family protein [Myxococcales bacterium]